DNFRKVLQGVNRLLWELEVPRWSNINGIMPLREEMTQRGIDFFREFVHEDSTDPAVLFESGRAHRCLASVHCGQQHTAEALTAMGRAIDLFEKLATAHPDVTAYRLELARTHWQRGILYHSLGQPAPAEADLSRVVDLFRGVLAQGEDKNLLNEFAWFRADCSYPKLRDPHEAIRH